MFWWAIFFFEQKMPSRAGYTRNDPARPGILDDTS
jgi:hypothetical protein